MPTTCPRTFSEALSGPRLFELDNLVFIRYVQNRLVGNSRSVWTRRTRWLFIPNPYRFVTAA